MCQQDHNDELISQAEQCQTEFIPVKCDVIHFGRMSKVRIYTMNGITRGNVWEQKCANPRIHEAEVIKKALASKNTKTGR